MADIQLLIIAVVIGVPVISVLGVVGILTVHPFFQLPRTRGHQILLVEHVGALLFIDALGNDHGLGEREQRHGVRSCQGDDHRALVRCFHRLQQVIREQLHRPAQRVVFVNEPLIAAHHVGGGQRLAVVELDAVPQVEGPHGARLIVLPGLRQPRIVAAFVIGLDQRLINAVGHNQGALVVGIVGIQRDAVFRDRDADRFAGFSLRSGGAVSGLAGLGPAARQHQNRHKERYHRKSTFFHIIYPL